MPDLPTGTVTLLFTDIEGSTRLLQRLGEQYAAVLADCRHLLRRLFQQYHGHEVDTLITSSPLPSLPQPAGDLAYRPKSVDARPPGEDR